MIWLSVFLRCVLDTVFYFIFYIFKYFLYIFIFLFFVYPVYKLMINK